MKKQNKIRKEKSGKNNYWIIQRDSLLNSFRLFASKKFFKSAIFDLITVVIALILLYATVMISNVIILNAAPSIANISQYQATQESALLEAAAASVPELSKVIWLVVLIYIIGFLLSVLSISFFYGKAWNIARDKKYSFFSLKKYFVFNLLWYIGWLILLLIVANIFVVKAAAVIVILMAILFFLSDMIARALFDDNVKTIKVVWKALKTPFRFHWFVIFLILAIIILFLLIYLATFLNSINAYVLLIVVLLLFVLFIGWIRNYIIQLTNHLKIL